MLGKITAVQQDRKAVSVELERPSDFRMGQVVEVKKATKHRTIQQNRLYWAFLEWCIHKNGGDLQSQGHFSKDALHEDIKAWIESTHGHGFPIDKHFSTAELDTKQFNTFLDLVSQELFAEFLGVDVSGFKLEHERYSSLSEYRNEDFKEYMDGIYHDLPG